MTNINMVG